MSSDENFKSLSHYVTRSFGLGNPVSVRRKPKPRLQTVALSGTDKRFLYAYWNVSRILRAFKASSELLVALR